MSFVHVAVFDGADDPMPASTAFVELQPGIGDGSAEVRPRSDATIVDSYRMLAR
ncbi:MAG TPA: hypothetical protein VMV22_09600 [Acidimicrobiales bacterium]|nr:hypothetical protein [Acidimicrobiales bacterium]